LLISNASATGIRNGGHVVTAGTTQWRTISMMFTAIPLNLWRQNSSGMQIKVMTVDRYRAGCRASRRFDTCERACSVGARSGPFSWARSRSLSSKLAVEAGDRRELELRLADIPILPRPYQLRSFIAGD
jgi:hypothetical protein